MMIYEMHSPIVSFTFYFFPEKNVEVYSHINKCILFACMHTLIKRADTFTLQTVVITYNLHSVGVVQLTQPIADHAQIFSCIHILHFCQFQDPVRSPPSCLCLF